MLKRTIKKIFNAFGLEKTFYIEPLANRGYLKKILGMRGVYPRYCPIFEYCGLFREINVKISRTPPFVSVQRMA